MCKIRSVRIKIDRLRIPIYHMQSVRTKNRQVTDTNLLYAYMYRKSRSSEELKRKWFKFPQVIHRLTYHMNTRYYYI